jgi:hypothetical protein
MMKASYIIAPEKQLMLPESVLKRLLPILLVMIMMPSALAGNRLARPDGARTEPQGSNYSLTKLPEDSNQYSLVLSDGDEQTISGNFSIDQLQKLRAVMIEAERFARNDEAVGTTSPVTTRFSDKRERAFIVDVEKLGFQSRLFFTLKTEIGRITLTAGRIVRSTKREEGFFFELLSRLESALPKLSDTPGK